MKFVDRDRFRRLTGFGRDMAEYVDCIVDKATCKAVDLKTLRTDIYIENNKDADTLGYNITPWPTGVIDVAFDGASTLTIATIQNGVTDIFTAHLFLVGKWKTESDGRYCAYMHSIGDARDPQSKLRYCGITRRGWRVRWQEHLRAAERGSHYLFHDAIRKFYGFSGSVSVHMVVACDMTETQALAREEALVAEHSLYPLGLNMIPGGNAGLAYLRRIGALGKNERVTADGRQDIINRFFERASRKGLPNPLAAANWLNSDYAEKVICAGDDRLKPQQIRAARYFASLGRDAADIASQIGARNVAQVQRLIAGETYSRIA